MDTLNKKMYPNPFNGKIGGMNDIFADAGDWIYMQYTGQTDKDGTEVYEEDILEVKNLIGNGFSHAISRFANRYVVTFENGKFTFGNYTLDNGFMEIIKILGNHYENPELTPSSKEKIKIENYLFSIAFFASSSIFWSQL